jgi:ParB family chromosome partitioning protein
MVLVGVIAPSATNPRKVLDKTALEELTASVRKQGILQSLTLRPWPKHRPRPDGPAPEFEIVIGERRWRAALDAGLANVPALVRDMTDAEAAEAQVVENLQRADLHPLEEAEGYRQLLASKSPAYDVARIAERVGRSVAYIYDRLHLLDLVKETRALFREGRIMAGHAVLLARLKPEDQPTATTSRRSASGS